MQMWTEERLTRGTEDDHMAKIGLRCITANSLRMGAHDVTVLLRKRGGASFHASLEKHGA
jgi:hypothetical protein